VSDPPNISEQFFDWLVSKGRTEEFGVKPKPGEVTFMIGKEGRQSPVRCNASIA
jgi:hypothetical protein